MLVITGVAFLSKLLASLSYNLRMLHACPPHMLCFAATLQTTQKLAKERGYNIGPEADSPLIQAGSLGKKWRSERNFCAVSWLASSKYYSRRLALKMSYGL